jgi:hypothetical protein
MLMATCIAKAGRGNAHVWIFSGLVIFIRTDFKSVVLSTASTRDRWTASVGESIDMREKTAVLDIALQRIDVNFGCIRWKSGHWF